MGKRILIFFSLFLFCFTSCSNNNNFTTTRIVHTINVEYGEPYISDDESVICSHKGTYKFFNSSDQVSKFLIKENNHKNNDYYWILNTEKLNNTPIMPAYKVDIYKDDHFHSYDEEVEDVNITSVLAYYYIYDKNLGNMSNTEFDVPYYTIRFGCIFYPVTEDTKITSLALDYISNKKLKLH